jgi:hypothetical protein
MHKSLVSPAALLLLGVAALLLLAACVPQSLFPSPRATVWPSVTPYPDPKQQLASARALWAGRGIPAYRLSVDYQIGWGDTCHFSVRVRDEQVVQVLDDSCSPTPGPPGSGAIVDVTPSLFPGAQPARTVSDLFGVLETAIDAWVGDCGPNGCECEVIYLHAVYDPDLGYPREAQLRQAWAGPGGVLPPGRACTLIGLATDKITVSLVPSAGTP